MAERGVRIIVEPGAILGFSLLYFLDGCGWLSAWLAAVLLHELGHLLMLILCKKPLKSIRIGLFGAEINFIGALDGACGILCLSFGPLFGLLYGIFAFRSEKAFLHLSGGISLLLTAFNLLPVPPLDGGRLLHLLLPTGLADRISFAVAVLLLLFGMELARRHGIFSPLCMGLWLLLCNFRGTSACFFRKAGIK